MKRFAKLGLRETIDFCSHFLGLLDISSPHNVLLISLYERRRSQVTETVLKVLKS
jgi:hypothetical protein